jgi:hypothetical protein
MWVSASVDLAYAIISFDVETANSCILVLSGTRYGGDQLASHHVTYALIITQH